MGVHGPGQQSMKISQEIWIDVEGVGGADVDMIAERDGGVKDHGGVSEPPTRGNTRKNLTSLGEFGPVGET